MTETLDDDLYERTKALLEPGDIELEGLIVHTDLGGEDDLELHELTVELNDVVADHAGKGETYIHAGNDDPDFASNQFQGRTLEDESFVWECQQLLREGSFAIVCYFEATADTEAIAADVEALGHRTTVVR
ncbi:DUF5778 family protein [Halorarum halobium]|uniref:DUF5778 family protein n=1 Tax=Halorarum halobium TaxID=3075121 RepID=UPI0028AAAF25|nr:DUF5778 family protein [Halobaculum sp. XH14]